jgi:hypothetical protein
MAQLRRSAGACGPIMQKMNSILGPEGPLLNLREIGIKS